MRIATLAVASVLAACQHSPPPCEITGKTVRSRDPAISVFDRSGHSLGRVPASDVLPSKIIACNNALGLVQLYNGAWIDPISAKVTP